MDDDRDRELGWLTQQFEENRTHLKKVAFRMLGSTSEADDAVQETWLRLSRSDAGAVDNLAAWLTTVVAHICLDMLRTRAARHEELLDVDGRIADSGAPDPEREAILADSMGPALRQAKGRESVANFFSGRAAEAVRATIHGAAAAAWAPRGNVRVAFSFAFKDDRIADIELIADPERLQQLDLVCLDG